MREEGNGNVYRSDDDEEEEDNYDDNDDEDNYDEEGENADDEYSTRRIEGVQSLQCLVERQK